VSDPLYIEFRLRGYARQYALWVKMRISQEAKKLKLKNSLKKDHVSHVTLFGPARTSHFPQVMNDIEKVCKHYTLVPFSFGGFDGFLNKDANYLYFCIQPSHDLEQFRLMLSKQLIQFHDMVSSTCTPFDKSSKFKFHSTVGKYSSKEKEKFEKLLDFAKTKCSLEDYKKYTSNVLVKLFSSILGFFSGDKEYERMILLDLLRVTILGKKSHIRYEYDLVLKKRLSRKEALSKYWSKRTLHKFRYLKAVG
jgi:hypothetical protein